MKKPRITMKVTLLVLLPLILLTFTLTGTFLFQAKDIVTNQFTETFSLLMEDISIILEEKIARAIEQSKYIVSDNAVQTYLENCELLHSDEQHSYLLEMQDTVNSMVIASKDIDVIYIYDLNGNALFGERVMPLNRTVNIETLRQLSSKSGYDSVMSSILSGNRYVFYVREIKSVHTFKPIGYVQVACREDVLSQLCRNRIKEYEGVFCIQNDDGDKLVSVDPEGLLERYVVAAQKVDLNKKYTELSLFGEAILFIHYTSPASNWSYNAYVPQSYVTKKLFSVVINNIFVMLLFSVVAIAICIYAARSITYPIREVSESLQKVREGDYSVQTSYSGDDELGELSLAFNMMVNEINRLINEVLYLELMNKKQEIKTMQAQINPHFIYNTFQSINALAQQYNAEPVSRMILALSKLMRASITSSSASVPIKDEIAMAEYYLEIQRFRFKDRLHVYYDINEELLEHRIPHLTLEPVVENAILHGFNGKVEACILEIKIFASGNNVIIEVADNGIGMDEATLQKLISSMNNSSETEDKGMGLMLVERRLQLLFGIERAMTVKSRLNEGTTVQICIPQNACKEKE